MSNLSKYISVFLVALVVLFTAGNSLAAGDFTNPLLKTPGTVCEAANLRSDRFSADFTAEDRVKLCTALDKIAVRLNSTAWSNELSGELKNIWHVFAGESVRLRPMPKETPSLMLAMAEVFPSKIVGANFEACVYVRAGKSDESAFFQILMHELRHVFDSYQTWKNKTALDSLEMERRAYTLMGKITQETPEHEFFFSLPKFWKESWRQLSSQEISLKRATAVNKYLRSKKLYRSLESNPQSLDFSYLNKRVEATPDWRREQVSYQKDSGEKLPLRQALPSTSATLAQNIQEADFRLQKPKNPHDEKEVLRVALSNEKKLYQGMSNFVYDRNLQFQCWKQGKLSSQINEKIMIARTAHGDALVQSQAAPGSAAAPPSCAFNYRELQTDFNETFWASPALEKMQVIFDGFQQAGGKTLARYVVLKPSEKLYQQLAAEYGTIKPFRVFVGTIFVSPEDGQIVKFWGTSFPEDSLTGNDSEKVLASYSVTALRQKLNINGGTWMTVYVGTVAVGSVGTNPRPFSYTVKFDNYRQTTTDVQILDDQAKPFSADQK